MAIPRSLRRGIDALGTVGGLQYALLRSATKILGHTRVRTRPVVSVRVAGWGSPVHLRVGGSDTAVFRQVLIERQYRHPSVRADVRTVIDCGANIGLASLWFLNHCPNCKVLAVEPEPRNAAMLRRNLAPYGERARVIEAAVWTARTRVRLHAPPRGGEWACRIESGGSEEVSTRTMEDLLDELGVDAVDLLKIDIEGAETTLFSSPAAWLQRVKTLLIECHGIEAEAAVRGACEGILEEVGHAGEIVAFAAARPDGLAGG